MNYQEWLKTIKPKVDTFRCPDCGGKVINYTNGECTRVVCRNKCNGWKIIKTILRKDKLKL